MAKTSGKKKPVDTTEHNIGQDRPRNMPSTGDPKIDPADIQVVDGLNWKEKAAALAFMEELIEVEVLPTQDKNAEFIVEVWCNGRAQRFMRGQKQTVKRKYVEVLARAKQTNYTQEMYKDGNGNDAIRNVPHTGLRYPFQVHRDDSPKGRDWLIKVLREA